MRCGEDQEGIIVCPIFYDVDPSDVRKHSGGFAEAFWKHERDEDSDEVEQWRKDLKASSDLGGQNLKTSTDGREGLFIKKILGNIEELLKTTDFKNKSSALVGMDFRVQEFSTEYLDVGSSPDFQIIGIWGMGAPSGTIGTPVPLREDDDDDPRLFDSSVMFIPHIFSPSESFYFGLGSCGHDDAVRNGFNSDVPLTNALVRGSVKTAASLFRLRRKMLVLVAP